MNTLELFAGIGGLSLGLERDGMTVVGQVEINEFGRSRGSRRVGRSPNQSSRQRRRPRCRRAHRPHRHPYGPEARP
ncbi:DNA cytosine methyltransferase [Micromonospora sp. WMMA1363]|uniref:DNA cytosine methyltransferase n=1 Tax=Micromonospora sp. WMMA1363 TaxID=3053985 RepID=UPI00259D056B|nr:DNA cytosine methyltransferase [Micromonospora sp. WMMA1363]MDM4722774.1 DNA cytosine methyltransferase [Micromonospora sp. WMMA1363]